MFAFFNGRLSIGLRLALVAGLFIVSSAVSAVLLANYGMTNIDFSTKERLGTEYLGKVWQSLQTGRADVPGHDSYDAAFNSAAEYADFAKAKRWEDRVSTAAALIVAVADGSNLTLDPDLDSYYAMDADTVKLPTLLNLSLALAKAEALPVSDPDRRMKIAVALDRFENAASAAYGSLDTSMKNNAAGITKPALTPTRTALQAANDGISRAAHAGLDGAGGDYAAAASPFPATLDKTWQATNAELSRLLDVRIGGLMQGLIFNIVIVALLIALSVLLTAIVTIGLTRRFHGLDAAMTQLNRGDKSVNVPFLADTNETGRIASTLARMKESLIQREADEKQREADRQSAGEAQRRAETEAQEKSETLVVGTFGAGLKALADGNLSFRLDGELPPAYRALRDDFNHAIAAFEQNKREREDAARQREAERVRAAEAERHAAEAAQARSLEIVVSSFGEGLGQLATRNLAYRMRFDLPEGYRRLQDDFNAALDQLADAMRKIDHCATGISAGASQISGAAEDLSQRTERQAASLEETAAAMEEITATVGRSAENAKLASDSAVSAQNNAEKGNTIANSTIEAMHGIAKSSSEITQIIGVIDEIAFQTNLLAINAAVEAAHAGDTGKGFAVVASEVRALAQRSAEAAKQIKTLIHASESQVESGVKLVEESGAALNRILDDIGRIGGLMADISTSQAEQANALGEINTAVNHMDQTTQQNVAMVEKSASASKSLAEDARALTDLVAQFHTEAERKRLAAA
jgi:methyl-accepting chemotaxis protein